MAYRDNHGRWTTFAANITIGTHTTYSKRKKDVRVEVRIYEKKEGRPCLTLLGTVGRGNGMEMAGQIFANGDKHDVLTTPYLDAATLAKLYEIWGRWHLNDMRAGCIHQIAAGWNTKRLESGEWEGHAYESEGGCLCKPCPVCGYKYGSQWLYEALPQEVIDWLVALCQKQIAAGHGVLVDSTRDEDK